LRTASRLLLLLACCLAFSSPASARGFFRADLSDSENVPAFTSPTNALRNGDSYVNVRTLQSLPGEIRGQIH